MTKQGRYAKVRMKEKAENKSDRQRKGVAYTSDGPGQSYGNSLTLKSDGGEPSLTTLVPKRPIPLFENPLYNSGASGTRFPQAQTHPKVSQ